MRKSSLMLTDEQVARNWRRLWNLAASHKAEEFDEIKEALLADRAELQVALAEWRSALQSLTPMGSEFTMPQQCVDYVRSLRAPAALAAAKEEVGRLRGTIARWCGVCPADKCAAPECEFCDGANPAALEGGEG
jgi:hypothetical protein